MSAEINLTKGKTALVDESDFDWLNQWKWTYNPRINYAYRRKTVDGKYTCIYMHRAITDAQSGQYVDHINRSGLDNRRENLRIGTQAQNIANSKLARNNTSGFRGVTRLGNNWLAQLSTTRSGKRKNLRLGTYSSSVLAAIAYDKKARELYGDFAYQNIGKGV